MAERWKALDATGEEIVLYREIDSSTSSISLPYAVQAELETWPQYKNGDISLEYFLDKNMYELWFLPEDHGPTVDTGVRVVSHG